MGSIVLILIATTLGAALYSYSEMVFSTESNLLQSFFDVQRDRLRERFIITAVWAKPATNLVNVTILNYGMIDLKIDAAYVNGTRVTSFSAGRGVVVVIGGLISVKFTSPVSITAGKSYVITLVSERGSAYVVDWKA